MNDCFGFNKVDLRNYLETSLFVRHLILNATREARDNWTPYTILNSMNTKSYLKR